jgi:hypothetical protein
MLTGASILAGGGAGAAAGLTAVLIMKGKNVDIDPGERFNLQLVQPMSLSYRVGGRTGTTGIRRTRNIRPIPLQNRQRDPGYGPAPDLGPPGDPNSIRTQWSRVPVYDARAERDRDGLLRVFVTAETSTTGWRIYTNHEVQSRDTLDVRLMGIPPSQYGPRQTSHPSAPAICVEDRNSEIRRIVIRGLNGARYLTIGQGVTSAKVEPYSQSAPSSRQPYSQSAPSSRQPYSQSAPSSRQPYYPPISQPRRTRPSAGPSDGSFGSLPPPATSTDNLSSLARQVANQIELLRSNYAAAVGLWMNNDGTAESLGSRRTSPTERQLYDTLTFLLTSARNLAAPSSDAYNRQRAGRQLQADTQTALQMWQRVKTTGVISPDLDNQWVNTLSSLRTLGNAAIR